jgi:beta-glucanase (GH16 family)
MSTLNLTNTTFDDEFNSLSVSQNGVGTTWSDIRPEWRFDANSDIGFGTSSFLDPASGYNPFSVANGALTITASPDSTPYGFPGSYESGLLSTEGNFSQTYGYYEMRADFSTQPGGWGAFWLLPDQGIPDPNNAGQWQELDVVESYGGDKATDYSNIHTTDAAPNVNWQQNLQVTSNLPDPSGNHTYGMLWGPNTISFYLDGQLVGTHATPSDMHGPMYLLADLATQDSANGPISQSIDYVRAYAYDPSTMATPPTTITDTAGTSTASGGPTTAPPSGGSTTAPPSDGSTTAPPSDGSTAAPPSDGSTTTTAPTPVNSTIGSGSDHLNLSISEDAYHGDAQYTVSVDGVQVGGVQTAHASHAAGQSDQLTVEGNWGSGTHDVAVTFLNDAYDGSPSTDRNLYVDGASYDDASANGAQQTLMSAGTVHFNVGEAASAPVTTPPSGGSTTDPGSDGSTASGGSTSGNPTPVNTTIGTGPDHLNLSISEDAYQGDAQYTVSVDGVQIGGVQTAHASHAQGQSDQLTVEGNWGSGAHDVAVTFLNDAYDGTPGTDRNLFIDGASYDGSTVADAQQGLFQAGSVHLNVDASAATPPASDGSAAGDPTPVNTTIGTGPDHLNLSISEDAYQGDAQYTVSVDGVQVGGILTAHALHAAGQSDQLTVDGDWGTGSHDVAVNFLNDAYDGTPDTDRNLYIDSASYDGTTADGAPQTLLSAGTVHFDVSAPASTGSSPPVSTAPGSTNTGSAGSTTGCGSDSLHFPTGDDSQTGGGHHAHAWHTADLSDPLAAGGNSGSAQHDDSSHGTTGSEHHAHFDAAIHDAASAQQAMLSAGVHHFGI